MTTQAGMENAFRRLAKSKFRSRFHLSADDRQYIAEKGMETIRRVWKISWVRPFGSWRYR